MESLFKCPKNVDAVVIDFQQFDADEDGLFIAPTRFKQRLAALGFECLGDPPKAEVTEEVEEPAEEAEELAEEAEELAEEAEVAEVAEEAAEQPAGKTRRKRS